ncbi:MAG: hypothetical protein AAB660_00560 [Patescibacteria group bacterium]
MFKTINGPRFVRLIATAIAVFIIGLVLVFVIINRRTESDTRKVRENLANVTIAASSFYLQSRTYTRSAMFLPSRSCTGVMFTDVVSGLVGLTGSPDAWPKAVTISCQADINRYAVSASLPKSINGDGFWCVDSLGYNGSTRSHQAQGDVTC